MQLKAWLAPVLVGLSISACDSVLTAPDTLPIGAEKRPSSSGGGREVPSAIATDQVASPPCPVEKPEWGSSCTYVRAGPQRCEYGAFANEGCSDVMECESHGTWTPVQVAGCEQTHCAAYGDRREGDACTGAEDVCSWVEGTCGCVGQFAADDGGAVFSGIWRCATPPFGCPAKRPLSGNRCVKEMTCDYGACLFGISLTYTCVGGEWEQIGKICD